MININCIVCGTRNCESLWNKDGFTYCKCKKCELVFINPQPASELLTNYYNKNYRVDRRRYLGRKKKWHGILRSIKKHKNSGCLLEIGCSYGLFLKIARESGYITTGIELSAESSGYARKNFGLDVICGDFEDLNHKLPGKFDIVCMWHTIEHLNRPDITLRKIHRQIGDGGILVITTPNVKSLPSSKMGMFWEWVNPPKHLFLFDIYTVSEVLKASGFRIVDSYTQGGDYKAFLLSLLTLPLRKWKYSKKKSRVYKEETFNSAVSASLKYSKKIMLFWEWMSYINLRLKETFGMDFIYQRAYRQKSLGPELFIIAKKI